VKSFGRHDCPACGGICLLIRRFVAITTALRKRVDECKLLSLQSEIQQVQKQVFSRTAWVYWTAHPADKAKRHLHASVRLTELL